MKRLFTILLCLILLTGCSSTPKDKTLIIGYTDFPPLGYKDKNGEAVGFDIDLAKEITKRMGVEAKFQYVNWDTKTLELNSGNIDAIWNGFSITDSRKKEVLFTNAYIDNSIVLIIRKDNQDVNSLADIQGKQIGVEAESSGQHALESSTDTTTYTLNRFTTISEALLDLKAGNTDVVVSDAIYANYILGENDAYQVVEGVRLSAEQYGIGLRMNDTEMQEKLNQMLIELKADGTLSKLSIQWFGEDLSI